MKIPAGTPMDVLSARENNNIRMEAKNSRWWSGVKGAHQLCIDGVQYWDEGSMTQGSRPTQTGGHIMNMSRDTDGP